jgi:hypothetical protein
MATKLTLTMDEGVIVKAKRFAQGQNRSLSSLIENYLRSLVNEKERERQPSNTPLTDSLVGVLKGVEIDDDKKEIETILAEKYLKDA